MDNISLIAVIGKNNELGKDNKLIWYLPDDLKYFKKVTLNHKIVMGYKTFLSIGKVLPKRKNIILTRKDIEIPGAVIYHDIESMIKSEFNDEEIFIIGGSSLYEAFMDLASNMYLTEVQEEKEADVYFPEFDKSEWEKEVIDKDEENGVQYEHVLYKRLR